MVFISILKMICQYFNNLLPLKNILKEFCFKCILYDLINEICLLLKRKSILTNFFPIKYTSEFY